MISFFSNIFILRDSSHEHHINIDSLRIAVHLFVQESTIGAAFFTQVLSLNEATVKFDIWDTAGQERYHSLAPMYYRGAAAAIVVYDITSMVSYVASTLKIDDVSGVLTAHVGHRYRRLNYFYFLELLSVSIVYVRVGFIDGN